MFDLLNLKLTHRLLCPSLVFFAFAFSS